MFPNFPPSTIPFLHSEPLLPIGLSSMPQYAGVSPALFRMGLYLSLREKLRKGEVQVEPFDLSDKSREIEECSDKPLDLSFSNNVEDAPKGKTKPIDRFSCK